MVTLPDSSRGAYSLTPLLKSGFVKISAAVNTLIRKEHARFESSRIRDFVPLLVEKRARRELKHKPPIVPVGVSV
jgi:hypothetical protein